MTADPNDLAFLDGSGRDVPRPDPSTGGGVPQRVEPSVDDVFERSREARQELTAALIALVDLMDATVPAEELDLDEPAPGPSP